MTGTFAGLNTALSALRYQQVALDVANNNIANVDTDGYVRRRAEAGSVGATGQTALWSTYDGHGDGVTTQAVTRLTDALLDARSRRENATLSYLTAQQTVLDRVETGINEPGDDGVTAALQELRSAFQDLVSDPGGTAARQAVLDKADAVATAFQTQSDNIAAELADQQSHATTLVQQVNDAAAELARLNQTIRTAQVNNTDVGTLEDQRDLLALDLAKLTGATVTVRDDGQYDLAVNGVALVSGQTATAMTVDTGADPVTVAVGGSPVPSGFQGELGGVVDVLTTTLPAYQARLDAIAQQFADEINAQHAAGTGLDGSTGLPLYSYDADHPAATLAVALTGTAQVAAASATEGDLGATNADALSRATSVESDYAALVSGFGSTVASVTRQATNQQTLTDQVDDEREQMAGVNLDEETVDLVAAQHAYEAASKVMSVLDSLLDTLIQMGVTS